MHVFPQLMPGAFRGPFSPVTISSGVSGLDELLGGGIESGTTTIISGPSGAGKTTLGLQFMKQAATRGEHSAVYSFEEAAESIIYRSEGLGLPLRRMVEEGTLEISQVEPLRYTPDEFATLVRHEIDPKRPGIVMIDSMAGYRLSFQDENVVDRLHALCKYLKNLGTTVILVNEMEAVTGDFQATEMGISYLADNIVFLRYMETGGELRRAIGVLKKRLGDHEKALRELELTPAGIKVRRPLSDMQGILTGTPDQAESSQPEE